MIKHIASFCDYIRRGYNKAVKPMFFKSRLGYCGKNVNFRNIKPFPTKVLSRVYLYDNTTLNNFTFITAGGKFIMKKGSGATSNLTIITGNHQRQLGHFFQNQQAYQELDVEKDVVVEEDAWIGANVTLLSGVSVGRGATVGAGSVCVKNVPPYAVVMGNPAKVISFNFSPEEVIEHEKLLYSEEERLPIELLQKNYKKYFLDRASEIKSFIK